MKWIKYVLILILLCPTLVHAYTKSVVDITQMSISDLADALDRGYLTSELLVTLYLERIEEYDDEFNAINQINENALEEAKKLDKERREGKTRSILHGIPIVVKTNINVKGLATTGGSTALSDNYPLEDAEVIKKLKEAGAIILASTNMSEFAFSASNSNSSYGQVRNAFNTAYTPYGSSGGSAVAVALSFASASLGTDTNSSVRIPASAAGLVGLRPTFDLISTDGILPYDLLRDTMGIITKTVQDNALILSIINEEEKNYLSNMNSLEGITIGVVDGYLEGSTNSNVQVNTKTEEEIVELTKKKIDLLESLGANIVYIDELINSYYDRLARETTSGASFCDGFNDYILNTTGSIRNFSSLVNADGKLYSLDGYLSECDGAWTNEIDQITSKKEIFEQHILQIFEENNLDLLVYPTTKNKVFPLNSSSTLNAPGSFLGSVIGYPSLTVPMGYIEEFPYGLEFFSLKQNEEEIYAVAKVFEEANNLEMTNSSLTPSLYEIPNYIEGLKTYYETEQNELTAKTKSYFLNYSNNEDEENKEQALKLIAEYQNLEANKIQSIQKENKRLFFIFVPVFLLSLTWLILAGIITKKLKKLFKKQKGNRQKKQSLIK